MNHERAELIDVIRATSRAMADCAMKMARYADANNHHETEDHALEIGRAAVSVDGRAKGLEE
jgi:hypothetical protein